jgi:hypothetical protein
MGYTAHTIRRLRRHRNRVTGKRVLTLGVLYSYLTEAERSALNLPSQGAVTGKPAEEGRKGFSEAFLEGELTAGTYESLDVDEYQGAEIICNLNQPIDERLKGSYDLILDLGTLEHLSNLSTALSNIFDMLKEGGTYFFSVPCNNWVDHGFFQFSPTFFADLCHDNPNLKGDDFAVLVGRHEIPLDQFDKYVRRAAFKSGLPMMFCGLITKQGRLNLDLIQSKYRSSYRSAASTTTAPSPAQSRTRRPKWRNALSKLPGLPLSTRLALLRAGH